MSKATITDPRIKVLPCKELLEFLHEHNDHIREMPENVLKALKEANFKINTKIEILTDNAIYKLPKIDGELLKKLCDTDGIKNTELPMPTVIPDDDDNNNNAENEHKKQLTYFYLNDLIWLNDTLKRLRADNACNVYLHNFMDKCQLELPKNSYIERNPELEKRCQRLRDEQKNREYMKMTKNVDSVLKNYPEDTIAFQLKSLNSQMIAVFQFVVSVITGFVFGFIGIPLLKGNMEFGARLLLGIFCGIVVAIAEVYFLAKKLHEYDDTVGNLHKQQQKTSSAKQTNSNEN